MKTLPIVLLATLLSIGPAAVADGAAKPAAPKGVSIMTGTYRRDPRTNRFDNIKVTGTAPIKIKKVILMPGSRDEKGMRAYLTTDNFTDEEEAKFIVKIKDKLMVPFGYGGGDGKFWSLELRDVDAESAKILAGKALDPAPKADFKIQFSPRPPRIKIGEKVQIALKITNIGATPWQIFYATDGGSNYPCRDLRFSFTATRNGQKVSANPKPLPPGFISSPFIIKPNSTLNRTIDLDEWLQFDHPGTYEVDVVYFITVKNPKKDELPGEWDISYPSHFSVEVGP
ncbi:hypothetical protein EON80_21185 [bacterium]|nr:MAG: hypothetical protein EON80_21185 [bacterium]